MDNTIQNVIMWNEAEEMRKAGKYDQALPIFLNCFEKNADEGSLWRAVHCARKVGDYQLALNLIEENKFMLGVSQALKNQFCWLKYDTCIEKNKKSGNWEAVLKASEEMLDACGEDIESLIFKLALFSGIDAAKALSDNTKILELTDLIGPEKLPADGESFNGKKLISYRERWFFARLSALFDLQLYEECRELSLQAVKSYPRKMEFSRRGALCLMMLGKLEEAEEELMVISKIRGCPWYIAADLAKIRFSCGRFDDALKSAYQAANMHGELQTKVNVFTLIAKIQLVLGNIESAKNHVILACSIRKHLKWKYTEELKQLASRFGIDDVLPLPQIAIKACEKDWKENFVNEGKIVEVEDGKILQRGLTGIVTAIVENRPFTFISRKDNGKQVYARISDIPEDLRYSGAELEFDLVESLDKLKNKKSVRAANIQTISLALAA